MVKLLITLCVLNLISFGQTTDKKIVKTTIRYSLIDSNKRVFDGITYYFPNGKPKRKIELFINGDTAVKANYTEINDSVYKEDYWSNTTMLYITTNTNFYKTGSTLLKRIKAKDNNNIFFTYDKNNNLIRKSVNDELNDPYDYYDYCYNVDNLLISETDYYIWVSYSSKPRVKLDTSAHNLYTYTFFSNGKVKSRLKTQVQERQDYRDYYKNKLGKTESIIKVKHFPINRKRELLIYNEAGEIIKQTIYSKNGQIFSNQSFEYEYY